MTDARWIRSIKKGREALAYTTKVVKMATGELFTDACTTESARET